MTSTSLPAASTSPQVMASLIGALAVLILGAVIAFSALAAPAVPLSPTQSDENWVIQNMGGYQEFAP
ncbi:MAG TPA: hypothetical protein VIA02_02485 [Candidatus Limnocylindria bacterium]|jgi:hypothetical protein